MTSLLLIGLGAVLAYGLYLAVQVSRASASPADHLDGGFSVPAWAYIFSAGGVMFAAIPLHDQLRQLSNYGFQANGLALGLIVAGLAAALFQKRLQLAASALGAATLGDTLGAYYQSPSIRIFALLLLALFSIALPSMMLSQLGQTLSAVTSGELPRASAIAVIGLFLFLIGALGGWRATVLLTAGLSLFTALLCLFVAGFAAAMMQGLTILKSGFRPVEGILAGEIPGVIQYSRGIGIETPAGGPWTTVALASAAIATAAIVFSPGFVFLGLTARSRSGLAFSQVWVIGAIAAGLLLLVGPALAAELAASGQGDGFAALANKLAGFEPLAGVAMVLMLAASMIIAIAFFTASGASIATIELVKRFVLPSLSASDTRLAARIVLAVIYGFAVLLAAFAPRLASVLASLSLSLAVQSFVALLGLCWVPWLSRRAVITGLILGVLIVFFTEPPGLILFNSLFAPLPWGRWPLTIHAAAWGLAFNIGIALLAAIFTRRGSERESRDHLHAHLRDADDLNFGSRGARGATWSLTLLWAFFAIGPGAILGNSFFSQPMFSEATIKLGVPSLWVWQIACWISGVMLVWWLAYWTRLGIVSEIKPYHAQPHERGNQHVPRWIALLLRRASPSRDERRRVMP